MHTVKITAWVLWVRPYGEYDAVAGVYSKEYGKMHVFARGVRKMRSKLRFCISPFTKSEMNIYKNKNGSWHKLINGNPLICYHEFCHDMEKNIDASWICELLDRLTPLEQPSIDKYTLLERSLRAISQSYESYAMRIAFGFSLLEFAGHGLELACCSDCHKPVYRHQWLQYAGVLCEHCRHKKMYMNITEADYIQLSAMKKNLRALETHTINRVELNSVYNVIQFVLRHYIQKPLKADIFKSKVTSHQVTCHR